MIVGAHGITDFFIYEREKKVAIEANTARGLDFLKRSKHEIREGKLILLNDEDCYEAFDAIDAAGYSTMTN